MMMCIVILSDNLTYDSGFVNNGAALDLSYSVYDQVCAPKTADTAEEGNYSFLAAESTFSDMYESVSAANMYSEVPTTKRPSIKVSL